MISVSFGCDAVFLIGSTDKGTTPVPLRLSSGDIVIMGGTSRLAYHAVPRIFKNTAPIDLKGALDRREGGADSGSATANSEGSMWRYLNSNRVNLNVRQIWPGQ